MTKQPFDRLRLHAAAALLALLTLGLPGQSHAETVTPVAADVFLDSTGVCAGTDTLDEVEGLNVRHYRGLVLGANPRQYRDFYERTGISGCFLGHNIDPVVADVLSVLREMGPGTVDTIEGPNEPNNGFGAGNGPTGIYNFHYAGLTDIPAAVAYMNALVPAVRADAMLSDVPVAAFTALELAELPWVESAGEYPFDLENTHPYPPGPMPPGMGMDWSAEDPNGFEVLDPDGDRYGSPAWNKRWAEREQTGPEGPKRDMVATETGWNVDSDIVKSKYYSYLYPAFFKSGVHRTYIFQLGEYEHWGLLENAGAGKWTRRPEFLAIAHVLGALKDASWDVDSLSWRGAAPTLEPLDYTIAGRSDRMQELLLRKSDGTYVLLLWNPAVVWDWEQKTVLTNQPVPVTLEWTSAWKGRHFRIHRLREDGSGVYDVVDEKPVSGEARLLLDVPDSLLMIEWIPPTKPTGTGGEDPTGTGGVEGDGDTTGTGSRGSSSDSGDASGAPSDASSCSCRLVNGSTFGDYRGWLLVVAFLAISRLRRLRQSRQR